MPKASNFIDGANQGWIRALTIALIATYVATWTGLQIHGWCNKKKEGGMQAKTYYHINTDCELV